MNGTDRYFEFASTISFFEFIQDEYYPTKFPVSKFKEEIENLESTKPFSKEVVNNILREYPRVIDIFEQIFQLYRFTNTQLINFLFDVNTLNSPNKDIQLKYLIFTLENDANFRNIFDSKLRDQGFWYSNIGELEKIEKNILIKTFKETISNYIEKSIKNKEFIYQRIQSNQYVRQRISDYLFENLKLNEMMDSIYIAPFLKFKKIPKDTKSLHGKFGTIKITNILKNANFIDVSGIIRKEGIKILNTNLEDINEINKFKDKNIFVMEKYITNVYKKKQRKLKKFDFILLKDLKITHAIETNFYSTSGTKIGINEEEYIDLNDEIKEKLPAVQFLWVTDGNYWLTKDGEDRYKRDLNYFDGNILNYNQFQKIILDF
jgi:hypothetical protein